MKKLITVLGSFLAIFLTASVAMAADHAGGSSSAASSLGYAAAGVMALAAAMGTFSQSRAGTAALDGLARNPQAKDAVFVPLILTLALMESLVILSFVIALQILGKI